MFNFSLMGAGRIGKMHAEIINSHPECSLKYIFDIKGDINKFLKALLQQVFIVKNT